MTSPANPNKIIVHAANGAKPNPVLNNVIISGDKVFLAGVLGTDASGALVPGGPKAEVVQTLKNAAERLAHAGLDLSDVVSITIFVTNYSTTLPLLNEVYAECFPKTAGLPVRTCVGVAALPLDASAEFSIIAATRPSA